MLALEGIVNNPQSKQFEGGDMKIISIFFCAFLFLVTANLTFSRSDSDEPLTLVFSPNRVAMGDMGMVNKIVDSLMAPIWNEIMNEGMILGWGQLNQEWGDEWNCNFYYTATSKKAFLIAWDEFTKRMSERHPGAWAKIVPSFRAHKDNIYYFQQRHFTTN
jgi:hypothetical protein